jgi:hypothetical protein
MVQLLHGACMVPLQISKAARFWSAFECYESQAALCQDWHGLSVSGLTMAFVTVSPDVGCRSHHPTAGGDGLTGYLFF